MRSIQDCGKLDNSMMKNESRCVDMTSVIRLHMVNGEVRVGSQLIWVVDDGDEEEKEEGK